jgi:putative CocE/NonD family hydrolase
MQLRWFDRFLRGEDNGVDAEPPVVVFTMGADEWRTASSWPPPGTRMQEWFLHSGGRANTLHGDGALSRDEPGAGEAPDRFVYDPRDPVPTRGGGLCASEPITPGGVFDQRSIETRDDVLVYTSAPLTEPLDVTGPVKVVLHAATDGPDTDWTAKLVDVGPDGYARNLCDGIVRARYRASRREAALVEPGAIVEYEIDLTATSNVFGVGHCVRLEISSSNFPQFDRNPNTGEPPGVATQLRVARQEVHHAAAHPSRLVLAVADPDAFGRL